MAAMTNSALEQSQQFVYHFSVVIWIVCRILVTTEVKSLLPFTRNHTERICVLQANISREWELLSKRNKVQQRPSTMLCSSITNAKSIICTKWALFSNPLTYYKQFVIGGKSLAILSILWLMTCKQLTKTFGSEHSALDRLIVVYCSSVNFATSINAMSLYSSITHSRLNLSVRLVHMCGWNGK